MSPSSQSDPCSQVLQHNGTQYRSVIDVKIDATLIDSLESSILHERWIHLRGQASAARNIPKCESDVNLLVLIYYFLL